MKNNRVTRVWGKSCSRMVLSACVIIFGIMPFLAGCSLAIEEAGEENAASSDRMIGVFISEDDLTFFDWDAYLEEHIGELANGAQVNMDDVEQSEKRIYATVDKHDSTDPADWDIYFEDVDGLLFFSAVWQMEGANSFTMMTLSDEICDVGNHYEFTDNGETFELSGTIYVLPSMYDTIYYTHPVYQTQEGDIYAVPGGMGDHIGSMSVGGSLTTTLSEECTMTEDGVEETNKTIVTITYTGAYEPTKILVHQMGADNQIIKTQEYAPGSLPESIQMENGTEYIIVETQVNNPENPGECIREIYTRDENGESYFKTFLITEDGGLGKMSTRIEW